MIRDTATPKVVYAVGQDMADTGTGRVTTVVDERMDQYTEALFSLLRQPSVSTTGEGMDVAAELVAETLERFGLTTCLLETERYPIVYAEREPTSVSSGTDAETNAPTILFYGHYDIQPPGDLEEWQSPPFKPTVRDGRIYARGAGDNKGQFLCHACAVDALVSADAFPDATVKLLIEGDEESGSHGLREYLEGPAEEIADADVVVVADGPRHAIAVAETCGTDDGASTNTADLNEGPHRRGKPTIIYGNRGLLSFELDHRTANTDLHSGNFGGPVPAATNELVEALASMRDGAEITVDGFHDGIEITAAHRELVEAIPDDATAVADELELSHLATDEPYYERLLLEPTMTINGLSGGYQGGGMKTVLPSAASAKLDCRLLPGQDPDSILETIEAHLEGVNPNIDVTKHSSFPPMKTPVETPAAESVARALEAVWDEESIELPLLGGSLPAAYFRSVESLADVPILIVPYANHDQGNHSPNENLTVRCFENGIQTSARLVLETANAL